MKKVIAIIGPTASGKTAAAIAVARAVSGEIISADSMQIYKYMDIGTAKPTDEEKALARHHLTDMISPLDKYSAADFASDAERAIEDVFQRGKAPVIAGGTGLYFDALVYKTDYEPTGSDEALRKELSLLDKGELWQRLKAIDPDEAAAVHENNVKRVIRALEIYYVTGKTKTEINKIQKKPEMRYDMLIMTPRIDRGALYERIDLRVDRMIEEGLVDEIRSLLEKGLLREGTTAYQAIGYKEIIPYIKGETPLDKAVADLKQATRNYAKRQLTWFSRYNATEFSSPDEAAELAVRFLAE